MAENKKPEFFELIKEAFEDEKLVLFVGNGASRLFGLPSWEDLADSTLKNLAKNDPKEIFNYGTYNLLKGLTPREKLSMAFQANSKVCWDFTRKKLKPKELVNTADLKVLWELSPFIITTNYDELIEKNYTTPLAIKFSTMPKKAGNLPEKIIRKAPLEPRAFRKTKDREIISTLVKLHGCISNKIYKENSLVLTTKNYAEFYEDEKTKKFLSDVFSRFTVLFLGYSLTEMELLENIVRVGKSKKGRQDQPYRHFMLYPVFKSEKGALQSFENYWRDFKIGLIPYEIDKEHYWQLIPNLKDLRDKIQKEVIPEGIIKNAATKKIKSLIDRQTEASIAEILGILERNEEIIPYFFRYQAKGFALFSPLRKAGYFSPTENPKLKSIKYENGNEGLQAPAWPALQYLLRLAKETREKGKLKEAREIYCIFKDISLNGEVINNFHTWATLSEILSNLPEEILLKISQVELIRIYKKWFNHKFSSGLVVSDLSKHILPVFLNSGEPKQIAKVYELFELLTRVRAPEQGEVKARLEYFAHIDHYSVKEMFKEIAPQLGKMDWEKFSRLFEKRIRQALRISYSERISTSIIRPAIEDHEQNIYQESEGFDILLFGYREGSLAYLQHNDKFDEGEKFLNRLLQENRKIFHRMAFFLIGKFYKKYKAAFWDNFSVEYFNSETQHELYEMVDKNFSDFTLQEKNRYLKTIEKIHVQDKYEQDEINQRRTAYKKVNWLTPANKKGFPAADDLYNKNQKIIGNVKPRHPEFNSFIESRWGTGPSPITEGELLEKTNSEIVTYCNEFVGERGLDSPSSESLAQTLKQIVLDNPERFLKKFRPFLEINEPYLSRFLDGIKELQTEERWLKKDVSFSKTLKLVKAFLSQILIGYPKDNKTRSFSSKDYCLNLLAKTVQGNARHHGRWGPMGGEKISELLFDILETTKPNSPIIDSKSYINDAINNAQGTATEGLVQLAWALNEAPAKGKVFTPQTLLRKLTEFVLPPSLSFISTYAILGQFLPSLFYFDEKISNRFLEEIAKSQDDNLWKAILEGNSYSGQVNQKVFAALKKNKFIERIFETKPDNFEEKIKERYIQIIIVAYLNKAETINDPDGLINLIFKRFVTEEMVTAINTFRTVGISRSETRKDVLTEDHRKKVLEFWEECLARIKLSPDTERDKKILSALIRLMPFLPYLKGNYKEWVFESIPFIGEYHSSYRFFGELVDMMDKDSIKEVGEITAKTLEEFKNNNRIYYKKENIETILERLKEIGDQSRIDEINGIIQMRGESLD